MNEMIFAPRPQTGTFFLYLWSYQYALESVIWYSEFEGFAILMDIWKSDDTLSNSRVKSSCVSFVKVNIV